MLMMQMLKAYLTTFSDLFVMSCTVKHMTLLFPGLFLNALKKLILKTGKSSYTYLIEK